MDEWLDNAVELIRRIRRNKHDVQMAADTLADYDDDQMNSILRALIEECNATAIGNYFNIRICQQRSIDVPILFDAIEIQQAPKDLNALIPWLKPECYPMLVEKLRDSDVPLSNIYFLANAALYLALKFELDRHELHKNLRLFLSHPFIPKDFMLRSLVHVIEREEMHATFLCNLEHYAQLWLPEEANGRQISDSDAPMRRPVPKISRNAPCPCGSGRKYKKCCYEKDRETMRDPSAFAGLTRQQILTNPCLAPDAGIMNETPRNVLLNLDPASLPVNHLLRGYRRLDRIGELRKALQFLRVYEQKQENFDAGHYYDLYRSALFSGDLELAREIMPLAPKDSFEPLEHLELEILTRDETLPLLEEYCRANLDASPEVESVAPENPLLNLANLLEKQCPALSTVFCRAAIATNPLDELTTMTLLEICAENRIRLELDDEDPVYKWHDDLIEQHEYGEEQADLTEKVKQQRESMHEVRKELLAKNNTMRELQNKIARLEKDRDRAAPQKPVATTRKDGERHTLDQLRREAETLKAEIGAQQNERRQLRQQLKLEREKAHTLHQRLSATEQEQNQDPRLTNPDWANIGESQSFTLPCYSQEFQQHCRELPFQVAAKAQTALARFAAHDEAIRCQTKKLERVKNMYSIRIGIHYRLMLSWRPGQSLEALALISREDFDSWIRRYAQ